MTTIWGQVLSPVVVALTASPAGLIQLQLRKAHHTPTKHTKGHPRHAVGSATGDRGREAAMAGLEGYSDADFCSARDVLVSQDPGRAGAEDLALDVRSQGSLASSPRKQGFLNK